MTFEKWARQKQREMYDLWEEELQNNFPLGFELLSCPPLSDPEVLLLGRNPGVSDDHPAKEGIPQREQWRGNIPEFGFPENWYSPTHQGSDPTARSLSNIVFDNNGDLMYETLETNRDFVRAQNKEKLTAIQELDEDVIDRYRELRREFIVGIIKRTDPSVIVSFTGSVS